MDTSLKLDTPVMYILAVKVDAPVTDIVVTAVYPVTPSVPVMPVSFNVVVPYTINCPLNAALDAVIYRASVILNPVIVRFFVAVWLPRLSPAPNEDTVVHFNGPAEPFQGGGTADFEAHVKELTRAAFESSPLFRHYYPVHHPSDSGV